MILLDNRFESDYEKGDVLGDLQWHWLDEVLSQGKKRNVDVTLIGAGIHMIPQGGVILESFGYHNKKKLLNLLEKYEMSGVVFLSGDVHFAQLNENRCKSSFSQRRLIEATSSGLSHFAANLYPEFGAYSIVHDFWTISDRFADLNYGDVLIDKNGNVSVQILNIDGEVVL